MSTDIPLSVGFHKVFASPQPPRAFKEFAHPITRALDLRMLALVAQDEDLPTESETAALYQAALAKADGPNTQGKYIALFSKDSEEWQIGSVTRVEDK